MFYYVVHDILGFKLSTIFLLMRVNESTKLVIIPGALPV